MPERTLPRGKPRPFHAAQGLLPLVSMSSLRSLTPRSFACLLLAAAASIATSAPPPDWERDAVAEGDLTLNPEDEAATVDLRASAIAVEAGVTLTVTLDPTPEIRKPTEDSPIALFASVTPATRSGDTTRALPPATQPDPNWTDYHVAGVPIANGAADVPIQLRLTWTAPLASSPTVNTGSNAEPRRELAPRKTTHIHWKARIHADGYDDVPAGADVKIRVAQ